MTVEARAWVLRRNWIPVVGCGVVITAALLVILPGRPSSPNALVAAWFGLVFGLVCGPIFLLRNAFPRATPTSLRATAESVVLDGYGAVRSEDILESKVLPRGGDVVVELALRSRKTLTLRMGSRDAAALVDLVGARRTRFGLVVPFGRRFFAVSALLEGVAIVLARGHVEAVLLAQPGCLLYALLIAWLVGLVRGRLVVGADGFTTRWLFRERFVAFRDVTMVNARARFGARAAVDTVVELASGRKVRLRTVEAPNTEEERGAESRAMVAHVKEAFERSVRLQAASVDVPALVERGSRSARDWLLGLDALVRGGGSRYRIAAVSADMLSDVANDPTATSESRVGAAAALVRMDDETLRTRVRVAAEGCAEAELRAALLALADARDDRSAEAALASLPPRGSR